jgi:hypothetical protein
MIVYVETNFVLELTFEQAEPPFAEVLLSLSKTSQIELVLPSIALLEPFWSIESYEKQRKPFLDDVNKNSVINDLKLQNVSTPKCFISTDLKAFAIPDIKTELGSYNCKYIPKFSDALNFVNKQLGNP